ncbi:MAG: PQQ-binding-like beta-propeller repeat protein [Acidobacteria bacterium]|nr:PQQ-binding-like beta-propeller repeat protein [Acidobacteriota bacterium]
MFRGNPTRTFYGTGPVATDPEPLWRYPDNPMCGFSAVGGEDKYWCGTGWTGQPVIWERPDGITELIFGAYDKQVHFVNAADGTPTRNPFLIGDIIKGSVVLDPDGYALLYVGSRADRYSIIALDREDPVEIWSLASNSVKGKWNNDWDSSPIIIDDYLLEGGENSWWFAVKLNRSVGDDGLVAIDPEIAFSMPVWTDELVAKVGSQHSIESSTVMSGGVAYVGTGAGRIIGIDIPSIAMGDPELVFDFWVGDDVDATIVTDAAGALYVASEIDLATSRGTELGQLMKLDPALDPTLVWSIPIPGSGARAGGVWATPALENDVLYVATNTGNLLAVDTRTGAILDTDTIGGHAWSSPNIVDKTLIVAINCESVPALRAYDLTTPGELVQIWEMPTGTGCIESTPVIWNGRMYVGSRDGFFYAFGDQ